MDNPTYITQEIPDDSPNKLKIKMFVLGAITMLFLAVLVIGAFILGRATSPAEISSNKDIVSEKIDLLGDSDVINTPPSQDFAEETTLSPTTTPGGLEKTRILRSEKELDGFRSSNNQGNSALDIRVGANQYLVNRGFLSFNLNDLPDGIIMSEATLRIYLVKVVGNPFAANNPVLVDQLNYGDSLDSDDYGRPALLSGFVSLSAGSRPGWKEADVTKTVKDDLVQARANAQFRIHLEKEVKSVEGEQDFAYFEAADNSLDSGNIPQLVIKYH